MRREICSKLTIKTLEGRQGRRSSVFMVNFKHISYLFLVPLLLALDKKCLFCSGPLIRNTFQYGFTCSKSASNANTRIICEICSKVVIETLEQRF